MYGVPADLPVQRLVGRQVNQVCLGRFDVQFHCAGTGSIHVEGRWELRDTNGVLQDAARDHHQRAAYQIHRILDVPIHRTAVDAPRSFTLFFENGLTLTIFDDSPEHESFSVHLEGEPDIHV